MLDDIKTIEKVAHLSYKDLEIFEFQLLLDKNLYTNLNSAHVVFPIKFFKKSNINADVGADLITANNFFAHWIKEIGVTKYGTNKELTPTTTPQEIYQYSDAMLKHLPAKSLKVIENDLLFSKEEVVIPYNLDRRFHGMVKDANNQVIYNVIRSDGNFRDREAKFRNQLKDKYVYRIPLKYICDINISTDPNGFEPDAIPPTPDVQIVLLKAPMIQYEQLTLDKILGSILKSYYFLLRFYEWESKKYHTKKLTNYKLTFKEHKQII